MTTRDLAYYVDGLVEGRRGTLVQRQKDRSVWRVEEDGRVWFAKRGVTPKRRREIRREAENARAVAVAGFGPAVLASGVESDSEWIVVTAVDGHSIHQPPEGDVLAALASGIRRFHARGFAHVDLSCEHVFVRCDRMGGGIQVIDCARLERGASPVSFESRARDLATLLFSWRRHPQSRARRVRLLTDACGMPPHRLEDFCEAVDLWLTKFATRTRWRHEFEGHSHAYWGALPSEDSTSGEFFPSFDELLDARRYHVVRTLPDRENRTLGRGPDGRPLFFVKVFPPTRKGWSPAMREVAAIDLFQRAGILVNRLAAYAEDVDKGSMVAVKAAAGEPLDDLLRRGVTVAARRALAMQTARIWRRMRECGLRHRDAYPCHLFAAPWVPFVVPASAGPSVATRKANDPAEAGTTNPRFELRLIDLTRAGKAPFPKERWFVKDAAALWHGLPRPTVTRTDAVRWLREYFRIAHLDARAKRFARRVAAKERRIAARQARKAKR